MAIDWKAVARDIGALEENGCERGIGTEDGQRALELLLGEQNIREAVDYGATMEPGAFLVEMVLKIIRSYVAMERCYELYKTEPGTSRAGGALFLLAKMGDVRALPWVGEF